MRRLLSDSIVGQRSGPLCFSARGFSLHAAIRIVADPTAWERWSYNEVLDFDGARTISMQLDDQDTEVYWTTHLDGDRGGLYKMRIDRAGKR